MATKVELDLKVKELEQAVLFAESNNRSLSDANKEIRKILGGHNKKNSILQQRVEELELVNKKLQRSVTRSVTTVSNLRATIKQTVKERDDMCVQYSEFVDTWAEGTRTIDELILVVVDLHRKNRKLIKDSQG